MPARVAGGLNVARQRRVDCGRDIGFENVVFHIERGDPLDILRRATGLVGDARLATIERSELLAEGLPYQTLISSLLHKYAAGRLKEM